MEAVEAFPNGVIVVPEKQSIIQRFKKYYKEKIIDTGKSENFEKTVDKVATGVKTAVKVAGTIATVILVICPADGPFGEVCTVLATPALCALVDKVADMAKKTTISAKRDMEKTMGYEGMGQTDIEGYNDLKDVVEDAIGIKKASNDFNSATHPDNTQEEEKSHTM